MSGSHPLLLFLALASAAMSACGTPPPAVAPNVAEPEATAFSTGQPTNSPTPAPTLSPTPAAAPPLATSRGPDLQASDPMAARLDSGSLQLVEFFRFT